MIILLFCFFCFRDPGKLFFYTKKVPLIPYKGPKDFGGTTLISSTSIIVLYITARIYTALSFSLTQKYAALQLYGAPRPVPYFPHRILAPPPRLIPESFGIPL